MNTLNPTPSNPRTLLRPLTRAAGFTLIESTIALLIVTIGFLGAYATVLQAGKMASAAEEEALAITGLEERIDQLRLLDWPVLTDGTGIKSTIWKARPEATAGIPVVQETMTVSPYNSPGTQTLQATWNGTSSPTTSVTAGTSLGGVGAVKIVATLTWTGRRTNRTQIRSLVAVISRGGISKSEYQPPVSDDDDDDDKDDDDDDDKDDDDDDDKDDDDDDDKDDDDDDDYTEV